MMNLTLFTRVVPDFAAKMCTCDGLIQREWGGTKICRILILKDVCEWDRFCHRKILSVCF